MSAVIPPIPALDLSETPGIYYSIAYGLGALLFIRMNRRRPGWRKYLYFFLLWAVQFLFMAFTYRIGQKLFMLCVLVQILLIMAMIAVCCDLPQWSLLYFTLRAYMAGEFAASLEWQLFYYALTRLHVPLRMWINLLLLVVVHSCVFSAYWLLERRYSRSNSTLTVTKRDALIVLVITAVTYALSNVSYVLQNTPFSSHLTMEIFTIRTLADLGGIAILFAYHMVLQETQSRNEKDQLEKVLQQQYMQYRISRDTIDLINRKYHDLKHQIAYLRGEISDKEKQSMLDEMEGDIRTYESQNRTGNKVVDTILTAQNMRCQKEKIRMTVMADGHAMDFLSPVEICSLLGNALDNAIEAAQQVPDPEERAIRVVIERRRAFLRICVENRFAGELKAVRQGEFFPETTKEDHTQHGFGMLSMQSIAHVHDGSIHAEGRDGWFVLQILIPIPAESVSDAGKLSKEETALE